jgi:hypothetical protein
LGEALDVDAGAGAEGVDNAACGHECAGCCG